MKTEVTQAERLNAKLARIAQLAELNAEPEFEGSFFSRKLAEMTAARETAEIAAAKPAGYELPTITKFFRMAAAIALTIAFSNVAIAATADDIRGCILAGNTFAACVEHAYHNETTEAGSTILRGADPVAPSREQACSVTILRGGF